MIIKGMVKKGEYFDSISLMIVAQQINKQTGVIDSSVMMGTQENKGILKNAGLLLNEFQPADDSDLLIAVKAQDDKSAQEVLSNIGSFLKQLKEEKNEGTDFSVKSFSGALEQMPRANIALISVPGKYAAAEAHKALDAGLNVMIFSDNVSIEDELALKQKAAQQSLLVMGPDCGTAIIGGVPLAFANVVNRGHIGIVAASGTGLQEVSSIISRLGGGISHAIGTGGRDVKKEIGGIMMMEGIKMLAADPNTEILVLISKPPAAAVMEKILSLCKKSSKKIVGCFLGMKGEEGRGIQFASNLHQAALIALGVTKEQQSLEGLAQEIGKKLKPAQKFIRGLYSGGTYCSETQLIWQQMGIKNVFSNVAIEQFKNNTETDRHLVIDFGDDEYTKGRPHPMIDFSLRNENITKQMNDPQTAIILLDLVLGYGANLDPLSSILPVLNKAKVPVICSVTGTDSDPQCRSQVVAALEGIGVKVMESNAQAATLAALVIKSKE